MAGGRPGRPGLPPVSGFRGSRRTRPVRGCRPCGILPSTGDGERHGRGGAQRRHGGHERFPGRATGRGAASRCPSRIPLRPCAAARAPVHTQEVVDGIREDGGAGDTTLSVGRLSMLANGKVPNPTIGTPRPRPLLRGADRLLRRRRRGHRRPWLSWVCSTPSGPTTYGPWRCVPPRWRRPRRTDSTWCAPSWNGPPGWPTARRAAPGGHPRRPAEPLSVTMHRLPAKSHASVRTGGCVPRGGGILQHAELDGRRCPVHGDPRRA